MLASPRLVEAHLAWIEHGSGRRADLLAGRFDADVIGAWDGLRVARGRLSPGESTNGYLLSHVVSFDVGGTGWREYDWPGVARGSGPTPPLAIDVIPARMRYSARWRPGPETVVVEISTAFVAAVLGRGGGTGAELRPATAVEDAFVAHVSLALVEEARAGAPGGALTAESLGGALVAQLVRRSADGYAAVHPEASARSARIRPPTLRRVLDYIRIHLDADLSLRELAEEARMDMYRFAREFKEATGVPPHRYVTLARIALAKRLLCDPRLSISEIALRAGFTTPSHFATTFRRLTNATPRGYRQGWQ